MVSGQQPSTVQSYLRELKIAELSVPPNSVLSRVARVVVPRRFLPQVKVGSTWAMMPFSMWYARRFARRNSELRLHLGCGATRLEGWLNVDMLGSRANLFWDLRWRLPFPDGSVTAIFHEHMLEHLPLAEAFTFLQRCHQLLKPGGVLRIGVPDFGRYAASYAGDGHFIDQLRPARPTRLLALAEVVYLSGHRSAWDTATLVGMLDELGFRHAAERQGPDSLIQPPPDSAHRQPETLYVEAIR